MLDSLTTGQAARATKLSARTIQKLIDNGMLKGYRIPTNSTNKTREHRRVLRSDLLEFAKRVGMPITNEDVNEALKR